MTTQTGTIEKCNYKVIDIKKEPKAGSTSMLWSFKLQETGEFYSCGFDKPLRKDGIKPLAGDKVKFSYKENQYGKQVDMKTFQIKEVADPADEEHQPKKRSFGGTKTSSGGGSRDDYWAKKEKFDKETTQPLIMRQSANNIAANLVVAALEKDVLPLPSKNKADKFEAYMLCFKQVRDELTKELLEDYVKLGGPDVSEILGLQNVEDEEEQEDKTVEELEELQSPASDVPEDDWGNEGGDDDEW